MKKFIAYELRNLDVDRDLPFYGDKLPEFKNVKDVLSSLKESTSSLEFKVNQEIFGKDPEKEFKKLLDFWIHNCIDTICSHFSTFLRRYYSDNYIGCYENSFAHIDSDAKCVYSDAKIAINAYDVVGNMTFDDYFDMIALLDEENEEIIKEYVKMMKPILDNHSLNINSHMLNDYVLSKINSSTIPKRKKLNAHWSPNPKDYDHLDDFSFMKTMNQLF